MLNSRIWLSMSAFVFGAMAAWGLTSFGLVTMIDLTLPLAGWLVFGAIFAVPIVSWLYFFFRPRGVKVIVGSRGALSVSAFTVGSMLSFLLMFLHIISPFSFVYQSPASFGMFVICLIVPFAFWVIVFHANRGLEVVNKRKSSPSAQD